MTTTRVPSTVPMPVTMPALGASASYRPFAASGLNSRNGEPGSSSRSIRSRTGSLPRSRCRAMDRSSPPAPRSLTCAWRARRSATSAHIASWLARVSALSGSSRLRRTGIAAIIGRNLERGTGVGAGMSTTTRSSLLTLLLVAAAVVAACGSAASGGASPSPASPAASPQPSVAVASPSEPAAAPDVTIQVETTGGMCIDGPCGSTVVISSDGSVKQTAPKAKDLGTVSQPTLEALLTEVEQADFDAIKSHPFIDTCPIAYDGQQFIYT